MATEKLILQIEVAYHKATAEGYPHTDAYYSGQAALPDGSVVTGSGRSYNACVDEVRKAAVAKLGTGKEYWSVGWTWMVRVGFPAPEEAKIKANEEKDAKAKAEIDARHERLLLVAERIKLAPAPAGYAWEIHPPSEDSASRGYCVSIIARRGTETHGLKIYRKTKGGRGYIRNPSAPEEIWIEGPGYGRDAARCKANSKNDWVAKAVSFVADNIERVARDAASKKAEGEADARKAAAIEELAKATGSAKGFSSGELKLAGGCGAEIESVYSDGSILLKIIGTFGKADAEALIRLANEAAGRHKAHKEAERARTAAAAAAKAQA